ncbi:MAG TPA: hypothetical protein VI462_01230 [Acidimicrobiia bacterium]
MIPTRSGSVVDDIGAVSRAAAHRDRAVYAAVSGDRPVVAVELQDAELARLVVTVAARPPWRRRSSPPRGGAFSWVA